MQAANAGDETTEDMLDFHCHKIALRAEAALCAWRMEEKTKALTELATVLEDTAAVSPKTSDASRMLHVKMRWLVGWIDRSTYAPQGGLPPKLVAGAMSALDNEITDEDRVDRGHFDDVKLLLLISGHRCGVTSLALDIDWSATTSAFHLMLVGAEFDLAVLSRRADIIAIAILNIAAGFQIAAGGASGAKAVRTPLPIKDGGGLKLADCNLEPIRTVLSQLVAVVAFRLRRDAASIRGLVREILQALEGRLGADETQFADLRTAINGAEAEFVSHESHLVSCLLVKEAGPLPPSELIQYHLSLIACASSSGAGARTARDVLVAIADDWSFVLDRQRFHLARPALSAPRLHDAVERTRSFTPGALSELLDAAAKGLNSEIPEDWYKIIEQIGGKAPAE